MFFIITLRIEMQYVLLCWRFHDARRQMAVRKTLCRKGKAWLINYKFEVLRSIAVTTSTMNRKCF